MLTPMSKTRIRLRALPAALPQNIELRETDEAIQWRYVGAGDDTWQTLIEIDDITATVEIGTVTTLAPSDPATVTNVGTSRNVILDIGIPAGSDGLVQTIVGGDGIAVDTTDPNNPIVSIAGDFSTLADAEANNPTSAPAFTRTAGYAAAGDGGAALYKLVGSEPSHAGKYQDAAGNWYEIAEDVVRPQQLGARGDGIEDDAAALQAAIDMSIPIDFGNATYKFATALSRTLTAPLRWKSNGATLLFAAETSQKEAVSIEADGFDVTIDGTLTLDADQNAYTAFRFENAGSYTDFRATDLRTRNHYRAGLTHTGGEGIAIVGAWTQVTMRADVRNGLMAEGAGDPGSQGVSGITIARSGALAPQSVDLDVYIENIQSEDAAYTADQDGLKIFGALADAGRIFPWFSSARIKGVFKNCAGRSIKSQMHQTVVDGVTFIRENAVLGNNTEGNEEVDFQYGAGTLTNFACFYYSSRPSVVARGSGIQTTGGIVPAGVLISNGRIYMRGTSLAAVGALAMYDAGVGRMTIRDVTALSEGNPVSKFCTVWCNGPSATDRIFVTLDSVTAPILPTSSDANSAWVGLTSIAGALVYVQATSVHNSHGGAGTRPLTNPASHANLTKSLFGNNVGVTL